MEMGSGRGHNKHVSNLFALSLPSPSPSPPPLPLGDEILAVNGRSLQGASHEEAINVFRAVRSGAVLVHLLRREGTERER